jgi:hypothetical protein
MPVDVSFVAAHSSLLAIFLLCQKKNTAPSTTRPPSIVRLRFRRLHPLAASCLPAQQASLCLWGEGVSGDLVSKIVHVEVHEPTNELATALGTISTPPDGTVVVMTCCRFGPGAWAIYVKFRSKSTPRKTPCRYVLPNMK